MTDKRWRTLRGLLRFITIEQVAEIAALKRGEDPCCASAQVEFP